MNPFEKVIKSSCKMDRYKRNDYLIMVRGSSIGIYFDIVGFGEILISINSNLGR